MPLHDSYGNPVSTNSEAARDHFDRGVGLFLSGNYGASLAFDAAAQADPGFALAHATLARALMMEARMPQAREALARAQELGRDATDRERSHIAALSLVFQGKPAAARAAVKAHVRDHPRDAMAAQLCTNVFGLIGFSGEVGREADLLAYTASLLPHYGDDWWMMSMHALSLCETGKVAASLDLMEQALVLNPRNAQGSHFKAHALYEVGRTAEGRAYLDAWMPEYDSRALLHGHLSWHSALWALHDGDTAAMWAAVDAGVAPGACKGLPINIVTDTAAILYRAELAGIPVAPERWLQISAYTAQHFPDPGQSFVDLHAALAHAMAGDGERLARLAEINKGFAGDLVAPAARAWGAMARGDWQGAVDDLTPVMAVTERFGGSRAQRDLLELAYVNALMKLGRADEAKRTLATRRPVLAPAPPLAAMQ